MLLRLVSIATFVNIIVEWWLPVIIPVSVLSAIRLVVLAFSTKTYWLLVGAVLICALLFATSLALRQNRIILPIASLAFLLYDFIVVLGLLVDGFQNSYWTTYITQVLLDGTTIVLLLVYCWFFLKNRISLL